MMRLKMWISGKSQAALCKNSILQSGFSSVLNVATDKTSQAITSIHFFYYFIISFNFITRELLSLQDNLFLLSLENIA